MRSQIVAKWGNSLGVHIPIQINLQERTSVTFTIVDGGLLIKPKKKKYAIDDLLAEMSLDNVHSEVDLGQSVGNEIW